MDVVIVFEVNERVKMKWKIGLKVPRWFRWVKHAECPQISSES